VCNPIEVGGLGIKDIESFNIVLLTKWKWRYEIYQRRACGMRF